MSNIVEQAYSIASSVFEEYYRIEMDQGCWTTVVPVCLDYESAAKIVAAIKQAGDIKTDYRIIKVNQKICEYEGSNS